MCILILFILTTFSSSKAQFKFSTPPTPNRGSLIAEVYGNRNGLSHSIQGNLNVFNKNGNSLNAGAFSEGTRTYRGPRNDDFYKFGGNLDWRNQRGHSGSVQFQRIPQYNMNTFGANGNVNLYNRGGWKVDAFGGASRNFGPYSNGRTNWNAGINGVLSFK